MFYITIIVQNHLPFSVIHNLYLFSKERCTRPTILGLSYIFPCHRRGSLCIPRRKSPVKSSLVTCEARKLDHHVQSNYYDSDYSILVVQLLKKEQELHLAETIIYDGYQVEDSRAIGGGSVQDTGLRKKKT